jgi:hypothetical protein
MFLLGPQPTDWGILAATLAVAAAGIMALTSEYPDSVGRLLSDAPAAIDGAEAATASALAPPSAPARRKRDAPATAMTSTVSDQRGVILYLFMEAGRPRPMFAR